MRVGLLHPGEMGAAVGAALVAAGHEVTWASAGRSAATRRRAAQAGLLDRGEAEAVTTDADVVLSVCPPDAAVAVARSVAGFAGVYLDANAVAPATARRIGQLIGDGGGRFLDGGIVGPPPRRPGTTRLFLAGTDADAIAGRWATPDLEVRVVAGPAGAASALKLAYAAWTKGTAALLLAVRAAARAEGVEAALLEEWVTSQPGLEARSVLAATAAVTKGWRWAGEMDEIASMLDGDGLPGGFHRAAAEVWRRSPHAPAEDAPLEVVLGALQAAARRS